MKKLLKKQTENIGADKKEPSARLPKALFVILGNKFIILFLRCIRRLYL